MVNFRQERFNEGHAKCLSLHISDADYAELRASGALAFNGDVEECLIRCCNLSAKSYAIVNERTGVTYAIGGFTDTGIIWFLSSTYLKNFDKETRKIFRGFLKWNLLKTLRMFHQPLFNFVWSGNETHLSFIKSMGARIKETVETGENSFIKFEFHKEDFKEAFHV